MAERWEGFIGTIIAEIAEASSRFSDPHSTLCCSWNLARCLAIKGDVKRADLLDLHAGKWFLARQAPDLDLNPSTVLRTSVSQASTYHSSSILNETSILGISSTRVHVSIGKQVAACQAQDSLDGELELS